MKISRPIPNGSFKSYLENRHIVQEKQREYYVAWVGRFFQFLKKNPADPVSKEDLDAFVSNLSLKSREWQAKQAKDAVGLFLYFRKRKYSQFNFKEGFFQGRCSVIKRKRQ